RARAAAPAARIGGVLVQPMLTSGRELIVGMTRDPSFGPLVMFGLGGVLVEALGDVAFRIAPMHRDDARRMMREIRGTRMLGELRGTPAADLGAIEDVILRVSRIAVDFPAIVELDINPLLATASGAIAVDARVMLRASRT
ncbi:MAG TPA: acetate--CoA ligase family protein, partial [Gemmatimonadales bacterium]|nr:acetate--CoA ligase family protein [Gemmatimonadales bacterium]